MPFLKADQKLIDGRPVRFFQGPDMVPDCLGAVVLGQESAGGEGEPGAEDSSEKGRKGSKHGTSIFRDVVYGNPFDAGTSGQGCPEGGQGADGRAGRRRLTS